MTAKATAKSQLLLACWSAEVSGVFVEVSGMCRVPGAALAGEVRAVLLQDLLLVAYPWVHGAECCARGVWPWGVGRGTWVLITHLLFWSGVPEGTEQTLQAPAEIPGKCMASVLSSATWEQPEAAA